MILIPPHIKLAIAAGALAASFAAGWQIQAWRYDAQLADIKAQQSHAIAVAHGRMADMAKRLNQSEQTRLEALRDAQKSNDTLRAANAHRLRIKASCLPRDTTTSGKPDDGTAQLSADAGRAVYDLRAGIIELESTVQGLRDYARSIAP